jgi:hypothetical protein
MMLFGFRGLLTETYKYGYLKQEPLVPKGQVKVLGFGMVFYWRWASGFPFLDLRTEISCVCV